MGTRSEVKFVNGQSWYPNVRGVCTAPISPQIWEEMLIEWVTRRVRSWLAWQNFSSETVVINGHVEVPKPLKHARK